MSTKRGLIIGTALAGSLSCIGGPSLAQDDEQGGYHAYLDVSQGLRFGNNLALGVPGSLSNPEEGSSALADTTLALTLDSRTRTQVFLFQAGGTGRFGQVPDGSTTSTGFVDPYLALSYSREGANARFAFSADLRQSDISRTRALGEFIDEDGNFTPPDDLSELQGTGTRTAYSVNLDLETGLNSPIGFRFQLGSSGARYDEASFGGLDDYDRTRAALSTYLRFNPVTTGVIDLTTTRFESDDPTEDSETRSLQVGIDRKFDPAS